MAGSSDRAVTKDEIDCERHFLKQTIRLSDGTDGLIFSRGSKNESNCFLYNCHLCGVPNLPGERCLQTHISGRKHQTKLLQPVVDALAFRAPLVAKPKIQMNIAPGEPVPPGFEDEVKPMAAIQPIINKHKESAILGIEYCVELIDRDEDKEPSYICLLCDKRGDQRTIFSHWSSYKHRLKYLEKHFPSVIKELVLYRYNPEARNIMPRLIQSVVEAIEEQHGRLSPTVCDLNEFKRKRNVLLQEIIADKHFDEKTGPDFVNAIDRSLVDDPNKLKSRDPSPPNVKAPAKRGKINIVSAIGTRNRRSSLDSISSESDHDAKRSKEQNDLGPPSKRKKSQSPAYRIVGRVQRSPPFGERDVTKIESKKKFPTPKELSVQASEIAQERYKWEKYRCLLEIAVADFEKTLKSYEKNPEKHPLYPEEWKQFWNRRYKELQAEKKDPNKYDFKPEWVIFWTKRMKELHDEEVEKKKIEIRKKLDLTEDAEERTDELKEQYKIKLENKKAPSPNGQKMGASTRDSKSKSFEQKKPIDTIDISDDEDFSPRRRHHSRSKQTERTRTRSRSRRSRSRSSRSFSRSPSPVSDYDRRSRSKRSHFSRDSRDREFHRRSSRSPPSTASILDRVPRYGPSPSEYYHPRQHFYGPRPFGPRPYYGPPQLPPYAAPMPYRDQFHYVKHDRKSSSPKLKEKSPSPDDEGPLTVVAVLRLLTALEEHLGSLGPKVVDLLSKALALEKVKANSADDMLTSEDHCVFFETVKEKLKGQLIADVLDSNKIRTVKKAIKNIAAIIHQVNEKATKDASEQEGSQDKTADKQVSTNNFAASKELPFDRQLIVSKLAAALVLNDRTDITTEVMDKLIHVFVLLVKLSKEREQTVKVEDILVDLGIIDPPEVPEIIETIEEVVEEEEREEEFEEEEEEDEETNANSGVGDLESLTDSDLQTLLQNFKHLSSEEQQHLIVHLKKLETTNPARVEKLRKFVNLSDLKKTSDKKPLSIKLSNRNQKEEKILPKSTIDMFEDDELEGEDDIFPPGENPSSRRNRDKKQQRMIESEDEDDDYNFDDVVKAASKNIARNSNERGDSRLESINRDGSLSRTDSIIRDREGDISNMSKGSSGAASTSTANLGISFADTQNLIANLMGSLSKTNSSSYNKDSAQTSVIPSKITTIQTNNGSSGNSIPFYQQQQQQQQQQQIQQPSTQQSQNYEQNSYNQMYYQNQGYGDQNYNIPQSFDQFGPSYSQQQNYPQNQQHQQYYNNENQNYTNPWQRQ